MGALAWSPPSAPPLNAHHTRALRLAPLADHDTSSSWELQGLRTKGATCFAWHAGTHTVAVAVKRRLLLFRLLASEGRKGEPHSEMCMPAFHNLALGLATGWNACLVALMRSNMWRTYGQQAREVAHHVAWHHQRASRQIAAGPFSETVRVGGVMVSRQPPQKLPSGCADGCK